MCGLSDDDATLEHDVDWFGTARARVGYAADGWLAYVTGGYAFGRVAQGHRDRGRRERFAHPKRDAERLDHGGGTELALGPNWSAKLE